MNFVLTVCFFVVVAVDSSMTISPNKKRRKNNRIKVRKKIKNAVLTSSTGNQCPQPLRQRLELKGPRVKHVCRSASVALGQPIATFPTSADTKEDNEHGKNIPKVAKELEKTEKKDEVAKEKEVQKHNEDSNTNVPNVHTTQQSYPKRGKSQQNVSTSHFSVVRKIFSSVLACIFFVIINILNEARLKRVRVGKSN